MPSNKISSIINYYQPLLENSFSERESADLIRSLISHFTNIKKHEISLNLSTRISESQLLNIHFGIKDVLNSKPLQHIIGTAPCLDFDFIVNEDVLIPRPETEELINHIQNSITSTNKAINILDIGTGTGCIAICLQKYINANTTAIDISSKAIKIAKENAKNIGAEINFLESNILDSKQWGNIDNSFDIIVSNPPYVRHSEKKLMSKNVLNYDPELALFVDDSKPLVFYKAIIKFALSHLKPNGTLWFEINEYLGDEMISLLKEYFLNVELLKDFRENDRFCKAWN